MRPLLLIPMAIASCLLVTTPAHAQMVSNGGFETGPSIPLANPIHPVQPGSTVLTGWTVVGGAVSIITDNYWAPHTGQRSLQLSSTGPGAVEQAFATSPGAGYRLTFWLTGEPFSSPTIKHLRVTAGATVQDYTYDVTPAWHWDMHWEQHALDFVAPGSSTTLRFTSQDASQWGPALDGITVELTSLGAPLDQGLSLSRVWPDPLEGRGRVSFSLATPGRAKLTVYDVQGRARARLADGEFAAGPHTLDLDASGLSAAPGLYVAVLEAAGERLVRRFTVLR